MAKGYGNAGNGDEIGFIFGITGGHWRNNRMAQRGSLMQPARFRAQIGSHSASAGRIEQADIDKVHVASRAG